MIGHDELTKGPGYILHHRPLLLGPPGHQGGSERVTDLQGTLLPGAPVEALQHLAVHTQAQHLLGQLVVFAHCVLLGLPPSPEGRIAS